MVSFFKQFWRASSKSKKLFYRTMSIRTRVLSICFSLCLLESPSLEAAENSALQEASSYFHEDQSLPFEEAVSRILQLSEINHSVTVNKISDVDIRFFVIDTEKMRNDGIAAIGDVLISQIKSNFIVDRDKDIFVDRDFLALVLTNSFYDVLGFLETASMAESAFNQGETVEFVENLSHVMGGISNLKRLKLIRGSQLKQDNEWHPRRLADYIVDGLDLYESTDIIALAMAPIILHEFGHIDSGTQGYFLESIVRNFLRSNIKEGEELADKYAIEKFDILLRNFSKDVEGFTLTYMIQASVATLKLLREQVYFDAFDGLRGLRAESYRNRVYYKNCTEIPEFSSFPLLSTERINFVLDLEFPILTDSEYQYVRNGFLKSSSSGTHAHHFSRASDYEKIINAHLPFSVEGIFPELDPIFAAFLEDDPAKLNVRSVQNGIGVSFNDFSFKISEVYSFERAVNCEGDCWVAYGNRSDGSSIEVIGPKENLSEVVLNVRFPPISDKFDETSEYSMSLVAMVRFFLNAHGKNTELVSEEELELFYKSSIYEALISSRSIAFQCGAVTASLEFDGLIHEIRTLNDDDWLQIRIFRSPE